LALLAAGFTSARVGRLIDRFGGHCVMTLRAVDQEVAGRYGTGIYVRCAPSAGTVAQKKR